MSNFDELFAQYLKLNPSFEELDSLLIVMGDGAEAKAIYHEWLKALEEIIDSDPQDSDRRILLSRLENVFRWKDIKRKEIARKLIELNPCDEIFLLIMSKLPSFEEELLPKIQDQKITLRYLMQKCVK